MTLCLWVTWFRRFERWCFRNVVKPVTHRHSLKPQVIALTSTTSALWLLFGEFSSPVAIIPECCCAQQSDRSADRSAVRPISIQTDNQSDRSAVRPISSQADLQSGRSADLSAVRPITSQVDQQTDQQSDRSAVRTISSQTDQHSDRSLVRPISVNACKG